MSNAHSEQPERIREALGEVLRTEREGARRTLSDVAAEAGCSPAHLSEVERGLKDISTELLVAVCYALRLPVGALFTAAGERLAPAPAETWPVDARARLQVASARLDGEALRTAAEFTAFLAAGGNAPRRRIGFISDREGR